MSRAPLVLLALGLLAGCGSSASLPPDEVDASVEDSGVADTARADSARADDSVDTATTDTAAPADTAKADTAMDTAKPDTAVTDTRGECTTNADCHLYESYCDTAPCVCYAFPNTTTDPKCPAGKLITCFVPPCSGKTAACVGGNCVVMK